MEAVLGQANLIFVGAEEDCLNADEKECDGDAVRVKALGRTIVCQSITIRPIRRKPRIANANVPTYSAGVGPIKATHFS